MKRIAYTANFIEPGLLINNKGITAYKSFGGSAARALNARNLEVRNLRLQGVRCTKWSKTYPQYRKPGVRRYSVHYIDIYEDSDNADNPGPLFNK